MKKAGCMARMVVGLLLIIQYIFYSAGGYYLLNLARDLSSGRVKLLLSDPFWGALILASGLYFLIFPFTRFFRRVAEVEDEREASGD